MNHAVSKTLAPPGTQKNVHLTTQLPIGFIAPGLRLLNSNCVYIYVFSLFNYF